MKNLNLKLAGTLALSLLTASTFAQINWQKGGNANVPFGAPSTIGTDGTWNAPFSIMTNGIQRMLIDANSGHIGIGINHFPGNDILDILPDAAIPNSGYGINKQTVLHNWGTQNIFLGVGSGLSNAGGFNNSFVGFQSGLVNTDGHDNVFMGVNAGAQNTDGAFNVFIGTTAGLFNQRNGCNVYIGRRAGEQADANNNTMVGYESGIGLLNYYTGENNSFYGYRSGWRINTGNFNTLLGSSAGLMLQDGSFNTSIGNLSSSSMTNGEENVFAGNRSAIDFIVGSYNTYLGSNAAGGVTNSELNTTLGYNASHSDGLSGTVVLGENAFATNSQTMILGNNIPVGIGLSNDPLGPQNMLEINSMIPNTSGLRFRMLNNSSPSIPSNGRVLTVDGNGDVVLTDDIGANGTLTACAQQQNNFISLFNTNNQLCVSRIWQNPGVDQRVGIGTTAPLAQLDIRSSLFTANTHTVLSLNDNINNSGVVENIGLGVNLTSNNPINNPGLHQSIGITQTIITSTPAANGWSGGAIGTFNRIDNHAVGTNASGLYSMVSTSNGSQGFGVRQLVSNILGQTPRRNFGCFSQIRGAAVNIGYFANAKEPANQNIGADLNVSGGTIINYGVRASAPVVSCLPTLCNNAAGYFNGDVFFNRPFTLSDSSLKQNVQPISNSKQVLMALQPKSFEYTQSFGNKSPLNLSTGTHYGLLAQELQSILPNLVKQFAEPEQTDSNGVITKTMNEFLSVNYIELIPFLIKGYQQQQLQIDSLIAASNPNPIPKQNQNSPSEQRLQIELSDAQGIILNQNDPNPFAEHTVISYFIPEHIVEAKIIFFTSSGNIVQQIKILERGAGVLDVYASDLSSGIYTYSLIADGKVIDTKRMVKIK